MKTGGNNSGLDYHNLQRKWGAKEEKTQEYVRENMLCPFV